MFTLNHFIWLIIATIIIIIMLLINKYKKLSFNFVLTLMFVVCVISELLKILSNMIDAYGGGKILNPGDLPFHLCSIQIFFIYFLKFVIKNEQTKDKLLNFMAPVMLVGGFVALMVPTVGVEFKKAQVYEFFIYHAMIMFFALYILINKITTYSWKTFFRNLGFLGILAVFSLWINSILSGSYEKVNFMYLSRPPKENLPLLNLNNGWYAYVITLASFAIIFMLIFHIIMILIQKKYNNNI